MNWNEMIFAGLRMINHNIHNGGAALTERAALLLSRMESCLCSGDGLSRQTAFKAADQTVADRTLMLLGLKEYIRDIRREDGFFIVSIGKSPWNIGALYFIVKECK